MTAVAPAPIVTGTFVPATAQPAPLLGPGQSQAVNPNGVAGSFATVGPNANFPGQLFPFTGWLAHVFIDGSVDWSVWYGPPPNFAGVPAGPTVAPVVAPIATPTTPAATFPPSGIVAGVVTGTAGTVLSITDGRGGLNNVVVNGSNFAVGQYIGLDNAGNAYYATNAVYGGPVTGVQLQANNGPYVPLLAPPPAAVTPVSSAVTAPQGIVDTTIPQPAGASGVLVASPAASNNPPVGTVIGQDSAAVPIYADGNGGAYFKLAEVQPEYPGIALVGDGNFNSAGAGTTLSVTGLAAQLQNPTIAAGVQLVGTSVVDASGKTIGTVTTAADGSPVGVLQNGTVIDNTGNAIATVAGSAAAVSSSSLPVVATPAQVNLSQPNVAYVPPVSSAPSGGVSGSGSSLGKPAGTGPITQPASVGAPTASGGLASLSLAGLGGVGSIGLVAVVAVLAVVGYLLTRKG